jgi:hypothetical protein
MSPTLRQLAPLILMVLRDRETIYYPRWLCKEMEIWGTRFFQVRCQGAKKYKHALHSFNAFLMDFTSQALTFKNGDINILIFKENSIFSDFLRASGDPSRPKIVFS